MLNRLLNIPKSNSFFLFGPRQVGKTHLIKTFLANATYLDVNLLLTANFIKYSAQPEIFRQEVLNSKVAYVFIDEIQRVPQLLNEIHSLIEENVQPNFIMTGSSARKIKRGNANLLAGRALYYSLFPLCFFELGEQFELERALNVGLLPKIYLAENTLANEYLRSYFEVYLKEEIEAEALSRNIGGFINFLKIAAIGNGEQINFSNIARDTNLIAVTVKEYYKILEDTLIGFFLPTYSKSLRKKHKTSPKFYFFDTGVIRAIQGRLTLNVQPKTFEYGNLFETFIINEVRKISSYYRKDWQLSFLRTNNNVEVDLIIETPSGQIYAIEIKSKTNPDERDFESGFSAVDKVATNVRKICVCTGQHPRTLADVEILPYKDFLILMRDL